MLPAVIIVFRKVLAQLKRGTLLQIILIIKGICLDLERSYPHNDCFSLNYLQHHKEV